MSERSVSSDILGDEQSNKGVCGLTKTVILDGARTAFGKFGGALSSLTASDFGGMAIKDALQKANVAAEHVNEVIMGPFYKQGKGKFLQDKLLQKLEFRGL